MINLHRTSNAWILVITCLFSLPQHPVKQKLTLSMGPIDHIAAQYVDPAPGLTLAFYFGGEEIKFSVSLYNEGRIPISIGWVRSEGMQEHVSFRWIDLPKEQPTTDILLEPYELVIRPKDGVLTHIEKVSNLEPGDSVAIRWRLKTIDKTPLASGRYELAANPILFDSQQKRLDEKVRVIVNNHHVFEVRKPQTTKDQIEQLLRDAIWTSWRGDYDKAIQRLNQVLVLHPNSEVAYNLLGKFKTERARYEDAVQAYQRAIEIMESNLDALFPEYRKRSPHRKAAIQGLKQQLETMKAKIRR